MLEHHQCVVACCDQCGDYYGEHIEGVVNYATTQDALNDITTPLWIGERVWVVTDGGQLRCDSCEAERVCAIDGHVWQSWQRCLHRELGKATQWCGQSHRFCDRCGAMETTHETDRAGGAR